MMNNEQRIIAIQKRLQTLDPLSLNIIDDSQKHIGHEGAKNGAGHFTVEINSPQFKGKTAVACHRLIYGAIGNLMGAEIHALAIKLVTNTSTLKTENQ